MSDEKKVEITPEQQAQLDKLNNAFNGVWEAIDGLMISEITQIFNAVQARINGVRIGTKLPTDVKSEEK